MQQFIEAEDTFHNLAGADVYPAEPYGSWVAGCDTMVRISSTKLFITQKAYACISLLQGLR